MGAKCFVMFRDRLAGGLFHFDSNALHNVQTGEQRYGTALGGMSVDKTQTRIDISGGRCLRLSAAALLRRLTGSSCESGCDLEPIRSRRCGRRAPVKISGAWELRWLAAHCLDETGSSLLATIPRPGSGSFVVAASKPGNLYGQCLGWTTTSGCCATSASRASRALAAKSLDEKGFWIKWTPGSSTPWWAMTFAV